MVSKPLSLALLAAGLACCSRGGASLSSFEGQITMRTTNAQGAKDLIVKSKGDKLRLETTGPEGQPLHALYDPLANKVTLIVDAQKSYFDMDFSAPGAAPSTDPTTSTVVQAGEHKTIAGYGCEAWTVKDSGGKRSEVCIAQGIAFFDLSSLRSGESKPSALAKKFRDEKSFPLESVDYDAAGKELSRMEVLRIDKQKIADSEFTIPDGYKKVDLPKAR